MRTRVRVSVSSPACFLILLPRGLRRREVGDRGGADVDVGRQLRQHRLVHLRGRAHVDAVHAVGRRQRHRAGHQHDLRAAPRPRPGRCANPILPLLRLPMKRTGSMSSKVGPALTRMRRPAERAAVLMPTSPLLERGDDLHRLAHATGAGFAFGQRAVVGADHRHAALAQRGDVGLRGRVQPHAVVHRRRHRDRCGRRQAQRADQVVGEAVRELGQRVGGGRRDHDAVGPARQFDVAHRGLGGRVPQRGPHRPARTRPGRWSRRRSAARFRSSPPSPRHRRRAGAAPARPTCRRRCRRRRRAGSCVRAGRWVRSSGEITYRRIRHLAYPMARRRPAAPITALVAGMAAGGRPRAVLLPGMVSPRIAAAPGHHLPNFPTLPRCAARQGRPMHIRDWPAARTSARTPARPRRRRAVRRRTAGDLPRLRPARPRRDRHRARTAAGARSAAGIARTARRRNWRGCPGWARRAPACWQPRWNWAIASLGADLERGVALADPMAAGRYFAQRLRGLPHEVFAVLFLDTRHRALAFEELFRGTIDGAEVHPREVVRRALAHNAAAADRRPQPPQRQPRAQRRRPRPDRAAEAGPGPGRPAPARPFRDRRRSAGVDGGAGLGVAHRLRRLTCRAPPPSLPLLASRARGGVEALLPPFRRRRRGGSGRGQGEARTLQ